MRLALFGARHYDRESFEIANQGFAHSISYLEPRLDADTAPLAAGYDAVCSFVNDRLDQRALEKLKEIGVRIIALRCAGFNHVDLAAAARLGLPVVRVPAYSPHAVAEHAAALLLSLNRRIHRSHARVREGNFSLDGLVGFDLYGKTIAVLGTGNIGATAARIFRGFGCQILAYDAYPDQALSAAGILSYVSLDEALRAADVISLHLPLSPETRHILDADAFARMKPGALVINTGRGALIDSRALVVALKGGRVGGAGLDVYEEEEGLFFRDMSNQVIQDDVLARLLTFPNVIITAHQAFLTREALGAIAATSLQSLADFEAGRPLQHQAPAPAG
ncbi:MAG: 2-hydroxyacid dehydrogenase [Leptospirales bacterium]|nr:2-hydroxyacid dehydrogenase [Leptospirales bacterium]